ncbi:homeobox protein Dlx2b-like [Copidosoma floridanum]|uniref:homeobox protein Dlx2b-like n=1 Tax=Copidosoma floridanum TaxID=29053 RepID=UPI000C6F5FF2|nr:homeobox protein Dlx2b-like [Copidosoma floridanum]
MELQYEEVFNAAQEQRPQNQVEKNQLNRKRKRTSYSSAQIVELKRVFDTNNYLSLAGRLRLAKKMNLTEYQVTIWFQNRRMKFKKLNRDCPDSGNIPMFTLNQQGQQSRLSPNPIYGYGIQQRPFLRQCDFGAQQLEVAEQMSYLTCSKFMESLSLINKIYHNFYVADNHSRSSLAPDPAAKFENNIIYSQSFLVFGNITNFLPC